MSFQFKIMCEKMLLEMDRAEWVSDVQEEARQLLNSEQTPERSVATELNSSTEPLPNKELPTLEPEQWAAVQDYEIENALLATLVIENIRGIPFAINKLRQLFKNKQP